jgi:hypothetical protein
MTTDQLRSATVDLAAIAREGLLPELRLAFAAACREAGGLPAERAKCLRAMSAADAVLAGEVASAAADMFGVPLAECQRIAREVLVRDPWSALALDTIAQYRERIAPAPAQAAERKPKRRRAW